MLFEGMLKTGSLHAAMGDWRQAGFRLWVPATQHAPPVAAAAAGTHKGYAHLLHHHDLLSSDLPIELDAAPAAALLSALLCFHGRGPVARATVASRHRPVGTRGRCCAVAALARGQGRLRAARGLAALPLAVSARGRAGATAADGEAGSTAWHVVSQARLVSQEKHTALHSIL